MKNRKNYIDNIRWIALVLVIIYHIIYIFNNSGVITNINVKGIPEMDMYCIFIYPWIMSLFFVISGISSRYSLEKRSNKEFIKDRAKRILVPSIAGIFIYGWVCGLITDYYGNIFALSKVPVPGFVKYFVYSLIGSGPLWYLHVLFIASLLTILIRKIDFKNIFERFFKYFNLLYLLLMIPVIWLSSMLLNVLVVSVYRFGIYLLMYFFGYFVLYREDIQDSLVKYRIPLTIISIVLGIYYVYKIYGLTYTDDEVLQSLFTNVYLWISILAILGMGKKHLNFTNKVTKYMNKNNFAFYVLHYTVVVSLGFLLVTKFKLPFALIYIIILIGTCILLPLLTELIRRIPVLNILVLGEGYGSRNRHRKIKK